MAAQPNEKYNIELAEVLEGVYQFGMFHWVQYSLIALPLMFSAVQNVNFVFAAEEVNYRCLVPECEVDSNATVPEWWPTHVDHRCSKPIIGIGHDEDTCSSENFSNQSEICTIWTYDNDNSIVEAYDLACQPWLRTAVGTVHNLGLLVAMPTLGFVADRYGRKLALFIGAIGGGICGIVKSFSFSFYMYLFLECLEAVLGGAVFSTAFILMVELGGKDARVISSAWEGIIVAIGEMGLGIVAQYYPYWKTLLRITYVPALLCIIEMFIVCESPRWLLLRGKKKEAKATIEKIARWNSVPIQKETLEHLDIVEINDEETPKPLKISDLYQSTIVIKRVIIASYWWLAVGFIYYGLLVNSVSLPGNKYVNFILTAAFAIPGDLIAMYTLDKYGRKITCMVAFILCGIFCIASGFVPKQLWWLTLAVFLCGKMCVSATFNGTYTYTSELFPTNMRSSLFGVCSMFARVGSVAAPQTPLLASIFPSLPVILFGVVGISAGLLVSLTPETLDQELPDTVHDIEQPGHKV